MDNLSREELQDLRSRAEFAATNGGLNKYWQIAYLELAAAADRLDAMMARDELANAALAARGPVWPSAK